MSPRPHCPLARWRGNAIIELLIVLPFLLLILVGATDYAKMMHAAVALDSAVRVGVATGSYRLNQSGGYTRDTQGNISVQQVVFDAMTAAARADANPSKHPLTINAAEVIAQCLCPEFDPSNPGANNLGLCNTTIIRACSDPEIHLAMTASTQVDLVLLRRDPLVLTRDAILAGY